MKIDKIWDIVSQIADKGSMEGRQDYNPGDYYGTGEMLITSDGIEYEIIVRISADPHCVECGDITVGRVAMCTRCFEEMYGEED